MRRGMKKLCSITVRRYAVHLIDINEYLEYFPGGSLTDKIGAPKLNEIRPNIMHNIWSKQVYVQGFDCDYIT